MRSKTHEMSSDRKRFLETQYEIDFSAGRSVLACRNEVFEEMVLPKTIIDVWLIRTGISPEAKHPVSRIGIYTDFT